MGFDLQNGVPAVRVNPFNPEFTIVIFIQYKPRIAAAILDLYWMKMIWRGIKIKKITTYWEACFVGIFVLRPLVTGKLSRFSGMWNDALMHRGDLKGRNYIINPWHTDVDYSSHSAFY